MTNSRNQLLKNLSVDQLHRKFICSDHFEDSSYTDQSKTKLRSNAHPVPYKGDKMKRKPTAGPVIPARSVSPANVAEVSLQIDLRSQTSNEIKCLLFDGLKKCKAGYNSRLFAEIKSKTDTMSESERYCALIFDEMTIDGRLEYSELLDQIEGFEDFGLFGHLNDIGNEIMLFVAQGVYSDWKIPIAYFVSSSGVKTHLLSKIIAETAKKVLQTGLNLIAIVSDQGHNNVPATRRLGVTTENPYFEVNSKKIYVVFDAPNLFKSIKNNFMSADLRYKGKLVSFSDIIAAYDIDNQNGNGRRLIKLTDSHINPDSNEKYQISLALEIFSSSVSNCMKSLISTNQLKSNTANNTAEFVQDLNDLFDCLNSKGNADQGQYKRSLSKDNVQIIEKLNDSKQWIEQLSKMTETGPKTPRSFSGLIQTINAILMLYKQQKLIGFDCLLTSKFNIDIVQSFFTSFSKNNTKRTVKMFRRTFRSNCTDAVFKLTNLSENRRPEIINNDDCMSIELSAEEIQKSISEDDHLTPYFAAYLVEISLQKFDCRHCMKFFECGEKLDDDRSIALLSKIYGLNDATLRSLKKPSEDLLKYVERAQKIFRKVYYDKLHKSRLSEYITGEIVNLLWHTWRLEECRPHLECFTKQLVIRRLQRECRIQNQLQE